MNMFSPIPDLHGSLLLIMIFGNLWAKECEGQLLWG